MTSGLLLALGLACSGGGLDSGGFDSGLEQGWGPFDAAQLTRVLRMSPRPALPDDPTNRFYDDPDAAALGQQLFYDPRLSGSGQFDCSSCHLPELAFGDELALSEAAGRTTRHAPVILDSAWNRWFFWDGRCDSYWCQALGPIEADNEMDSTRLQVAHLVHQDADYADAYQAIFGALPELDDGSRFPAAGRPSGDAEDPDQRAWDSMSAEDQQAVDQVFANVGKAIAAFERLLVTGDAPIDAYVAAIQANDATAAQAALGESAIRGLQLFVGDAHCHLCHSGPALSDFEFHTLDLRWLPGMDESDLGRYDGVEDLRANPFNGAGAYSDDPAYGAGRIDPLIVSSEQVAAYKTPTLRNVALSAPYMHGGHFADLHEVVDFYDLLDQEGIGSGHRDEILVPLELSEQDRADLVAFLTEALTGTPPDDSLLSPPR